MPLLSLSHVTMHHGGPVLLDDVTLDVEAGRKIGVVGNNGVGKSTMLNLLAGLADPVAGQVVRARGVRVAHQAQELACAPGATVFDEMRRVFGQSHERDARLRTLEELLAGAEGDERRRLLAEYEELSHRHEAEGGYDVERRIETVLSSLGLSPETWHQPMDVFSGGERNVIGLARVLLAEPDVMLLDEPSNHLDMDGVEWFLSLVRRSQAAVVMVSHNRHLLDATADEIWEVHGGKVTAWTGNYGDFQRQKAEAAALQERQWKSQQRLIRRIEFQARRMKDMANAYDDPGQARRAKAMLARIDRMEKVEKPASEARTFGGSLAGGDRHGRIALVVRDFSYAYGDRPIFEKANLEIEYGERVCLVGPNGSGKSTLFREILEHGAWDHPTLRVGKSVVAGEYRQLHEDALERDMTLLDWAQEATGLLRTPASDLLHRFLFKRDDLDRRIATLSGGEKSRLQLARLVQKRVNLLLLDEPTNHLDLQACEQLEDMLEEFEGTLLVISHDRWFLDRLVDRVVEVEGRGLVSHRESFAQWWARKAAERQGRRSALELRSVRAAADDAKADSAADRESKKARGREARRLASEMRTVESKIAKAEERVKAVDREIEAHYATAGDHVRGRTLADDGAAARAEVADLYARWERLASAADAASDAVPDA